MLAALDFEFMKAAELIPLHALLDTQDPEPHSGARNGVVPRIGQTDHQRGTAITRCHNGVLGEHEAGARPREPGKYQPGQHRQETHPGEDFDGGDEMPVVGLRVHVAVADRRQRLDGEVEQLEEALAANIGDRIGAERIEQCEDAVQRDEDDGGRAEEHRPVHGHRAVIEVGPETLI